MDIDADFDRLEIAENSMSSSTGLSAELRELHRITIHSNIGDCVSQLQTQLERPIGQIEDFATWIHAAVQALEAAFSK